MGFTKLSSGIVHSSLWVESDEVLRVWIAMLALADRHGNVLVHPDTLARLCRKRRSVLDRVLTKLNSPDLSSRSVDHEGRRIVPIPGGWHLVNYKSYREMRDDAERTEAQRIWVAEKRASASVSTVSTKAEANAEANAYAEANADLDPAPAPAPEAVAPAPSPATPAPVKRSRAEQGSRLPEQWEPSSSRAYENVMREFSDVIALADIPGLVAAFRDYWRGVPGQQGRKVDWDGTFRNHLRREGEFRRRGQRGGRQQSLSMIPKQPIPEHREWKMPEDA